MTEKAVEELKAFVETNVFSDDPNSFLILYGGSIYKKLSESDLDFAVVTTDYTEEICIKLEAFVIQLHKKYDLRIDTEVPFRNKLVYSKKEIDYALGLRCFIKKGDRYEVPAIEKTKEFLASENVKARLIVNALTTPHEFWGNAKEGAAAEIRASLAITVLALGLSDRPTFSTSELRGVLESSKRGEDGEDYLGYKTQYTIVNDYLDGSLGLGLSVLHDGGYLESEDRAHWRRHEDYVAKNALEMKV